MSTFSLEYDTVPHPRYGYPRGLYRGQDIIDYLEALPNGERLIYDQAQSFINTCGVVSLLPGGVPPKELLQVPTVAPGTVVALIRQHYGRLEAQAMMKEACPYVTESKYPIPEDWAHAEVMRHLSSLSDNTIIPTDQAWIYLKQSGVKDAGHRLKRGGIEQRPPGKLVGEVIQIIREFDEEERRRAELESIYFVAYRDGEPV